MNRRAIAAIVLLIGCDAGPSEPSPPGVQETLDAAAVLAGQAQDLHRPGELAFGWGETVLAYGFHRLHASTGAPQWQGYYRIWQTTAAGSLPDMVSSASMSPALVASVLMVEDASVDLTGTTEAAHAYLDTAPRTDEGAIAHRGPEDPEFGGAAQVSIDSLGMWGIFLVSEHERTGDRDLLDRFVEQYQLFSDLCRSSSDLYLHAYDDSLDANIPDADVFWARGNAWVLVAAAELLSRFPDDSAADAVRPLFERHVASTLATQTASGHWRTVMNSPRGEDPANYEETSAGALIGYALARAYHAGALGDDVLPALDAAVRGVASRLVEQSDGHVTLQGTSSETRPGDYEDYLATLQVDDEISGVGAAVMFLAEVDGVPRPSVEP